MPKLVISAKLAYEVLLELMGFDVEELWALALGPEKNLLRSKMIFRGTVDACLVHPRDIFRFACVENASSLLVAHNHPSGSTRPSEQDLVFTRQLLRASRALQIPLLDHLITSPMNYASFAEQGWCNFEAHYPLTTCRAEPITAGGLRSSDGQQLSLAEQGW